MKINDLDKCIKCVHNKVCTYKNQFSETVENIIHNTENAPSILSIDMNCSEYRNQKQDDWSRI